MKKYGEFIQYDDISLLKYFAPRFNTFRYVKMYESMGEIQKEFITKLRYESLLKDLADKTPLEKRELKGVEDCNYILELIRK